MERSAEEFWAKMQQNTDFLSNPAKKVELEFRNTRTKNFLLKSIIGDYSNSENLLNVYANILSSL